MSSSFNIIIIANIEGFPKSPPVSIGEHEKMCAAIAEHDPERAERAMYEHIHSSRDLIEQRVKERSDPVS
jgi:DNA-binding GntR family transcriptional regulator